MIGVAVIWTAFTFSMVWVNWLIALQLVTVWGSVGLLIVVFGEYASIASKPEFSGEKKVKDNGSVAAKAHNVDLPSTDDASAISNEDANAVTGTRQITALIASMLEGGGSAVETSDTMLKGFNRALGDINTDLQIKVEKMEANREISIQLDALKRSVESVIRIAETKRETQRMLATDPVFAKHYGRLSKRVREEVSETGICDKCEFPTLNETPKRAADLPLRAADERAAKLTESLDLLASSIARVAEDAGLSREIDNHTHEPFLPFLRRQQDVLSEHLRLLRATSRQDRTIHKSPAYGEILPQKFSEIGEPPPDRLKSLPRETATADYLSKRREAIQNYANEIAIPHLVHFTRCENIPGILSHGLMSIATCSKEGIAYVRNDEERFDRQPNGISLSIAFPNDRMFYKYRMNSGVDWVVLLICPSVLWEKDCAFYRHNAADARVNREPLNKMKSLKAFRDMFVGDAGPREAWLRRFDPTDPQAEILVFETVPRTCIEAAAFETGETHARYSHLMGGIETFYAGAGKGLFGPRSKARRT